MNRSDLVKVALTGDLGKPRPALVVQSDLFALTGSVIILPLTSVLDGAVPFRVRLEPSGTNGLQRPSLIMVDKITNIRREKVGGVIGAVDNDTMIAVTRQLALFLGMT